MILLTNYSLGIKWYPISVSYIYAWRFTFQKWSEFFRAVDPDIVTGYNIQNFDFPYLLNRAIALKVKEFPHLGRIVGISSVIKEAMLQSKQMGRRENKIINIEGRVQFDLLQVNRL